MTDVGERTRFQSHYLRAIVAKSSPQQTIQSAIDELQDFQAFLLLHIASAVERDDLPPDNKTSRFYEARRLLSSAEIRRLSINSPLEVVVWVGVVGSTLFGGAHKAISTWTAFSEARVRHHESKLQVAVLRELTEQVKADIFEDSARNVTWVTDVDQIENEHRAAERALLGMSDLDLIPEDELEP